MKRLNFIWSLILIGITFAACSKDDVSILTVTPAQVSIDADGGTGSIAIKTDANSWSIANPASDWLTVSSTSGNLKDATISLGWAQITRW
jgi:endoglucanase